MCGIVGSPGLTGDSFRVNEEYPVRMRDTMAHRGPDGVGTWLSNDGHVGMGHRRLAIIDLSDACRHMTGQTLVVDDGFTLYGFTL